MPHTINTINTAYIGTRTLLINALGVQILPLPILIESKYLLRLSAHRFAFMYYNDTTN